MNEGCTFREVEGFEKALYDLARQNQLRTNLSVKDVSFKSFWFLFVNVAGFFGLDPKQSYFVILVKKCFDFFLSVRCYDAKIEGYSENDASKLVVTAPPRHGKSLICSAIFSAWALGVDPTTRIILVANTKKLAEEHLRTCKTIMEMDYYKNEFQDTTIDKKCNRQNHLGTTSGGQIFTSSLRSGAIGMGGDFIIIDDPHNPNDINSKKKLKNAATWYQTTIRSRLNSSGRGGILCSMQRLHENDLVSHFEKNDKNWNFLNFQIKSEERVEYKNVFEDGTNECIHFNGPHIVIQKGEILNKSMYNHKQIETLKATLREDIFWGQYMQNPVEKALGYVKESYLKIFNPSFLPQYFGYSDIVMSDDIKNRDEENGSALSTNITQDILCSSAKSGDPLSNSNSLESINENNAASVDSPYSLVHSSENDKNYMKSENNHILSVETLVGDSVGIDDIEENIKASKAGVGDRKDRLRGGSLGDAVLAVQQIDLENNNSFLLKGDIEENIKARQACKALSFSTSNLSSSGDSAGDPLNNSHPSNNSNINDIGKGGFLIANKYATGNDNTFNNKGYIVQSWDTASTAQSGDYSVCTVWYVLDDKYYLIDVKREQLAYPELRALVLSQYEKYGGIILIEACSSGRPIFDELRAKDIQAYDMKPIVNKQQRLLEVMFFFEKGAIYIPDDKWINNNYCGENILEESQADEVLLNNNDDEDSKKASQAGVGDRKDRLRDGSLGDATLTAQQLHYNNANCHPPINVKNAGDPLNNNIDSCHPTRNAMKAGNPLDSSQSSNNSNVKSSGKGGSPEHSPEDDSTFNKLNSMTTPSINNKNPQTGENSLAWVRKFKNELCSFPASKYDDQVDSVTQFLKWLIDKKMFGAKKGPSIGNI